MFGNDIKTLLNNREDLVSDDVLRLVYIAVVVNLLLLGLDECVRVDDFL